MSLASYDAHRRRMLELEIMKAARRQYDDDLPVDWLAVAAGACLGLSLLVLLTIVAWFAPEIVEFTR